MVEQITNVHGALLPGRSSVAAEDGWLIRVGTTTGPEQRWFTTDRTQAIGFLTALKHPLAECGSDQGRIFKIQLTPDGTTRGYVLAVRTGERLV